MYLIIRMHWLLRYYVKKNHLYLSYGVLFFKSGSPEVLILSALRVVLTYVNIPYNLDRYIKSGDMISRRQKQQRKTEKSSLSLIETVH